MRTLMCGAAALGLLSCMGIAGLGIAPAGAQVVSDPTVIRSCLCEEQFVLGLQDNVNARRQALDASQKVQASLVNQVETQRAQINVYDSNEVNAFKQLLQKRDDAIAATGAATKTYNDAADRYNAAVAAYNGSCAGHTYDETVLRAVRTTLVCPRPSNGP